MRSHERITVGAFNGRVCFSCRFASTNTYILETPATGPVHVRVTDAGKLYHPDETFPWEVSTVLEVIGEYERRCWAAFVAWCDEKGYGIGEQRPHVLACPFMPLESVK